MLLTGYGFEFFESRSGSKRLKGNPRSIHGVLRNGKGGARSVFFLENLALQLGLGQHTSLRDSNNVAATFSVTKAT